jgi:hypothetical protein
MCMISSVGEAMGSAPAYGDQSWWWRWLELMVEAACAVAGADGGGSLRSGWCRWWWLRSCMWVWAPPMSVSGWSHQSRCREARCNNIYLFKICIVATDLLTSVNLLLLCCTVAMGQSRLSLLCHHCSDGIVVMSRLLIATVSSEPLV